MCVSKYGIFEMFYIDSASWIGSAWRGLAHELGQSDSDLVRFNSSVMSELKSENKKWGAIFGECSCILAAQSCEFNIGARGSLCVLFDIWSLAELGSTWQNFLKPMAVKGKTGPWCIYSASPGESQKSGNSRMVGKYPYVLHNADCDVQGEGR